tara:strand:+ start:1331 stop:2275 length:945 start_codon:yes stop_codon:yes gene_type:complete
MLELKEAFINHKLLFLYGKTKSGKTSSILNYMKTHQKDYSYSSIQDIKNEEHFLSLLECQNIYHMFLKKTDSQDSKSYPEKYIIIDNIDYLQNNDKKIINVFIKFLKKQKQLQYPHVRFIFIGSNIKDKKVMELMEYMDLQYEYIPSIDVDYDKNIKDIVACFLNNGNYDVEGLCDKNIISLCFHENVIQILKDNLPLYETFLYNFCSGDYYDRISFKKQLWQFNEMSFYLKVVYNAYLCKQCATNSPLSGKEIEFTKILTKFSNEYSNQNFIIHMCEKLKCQKEELYEHLLCESDKWEQFTVQEQKRIRKLLL